ncbi:hypothetical protein Y032_0002g755 [Ancylostoma ceylanicum]|uniref:Uncharacterized protein n=1 Tax=Ancylostoma ceylanicum TaxID=53326 RepID=A0A016W0I4_9BILA|nr:hypothetical protein Y032_0002g755 [Ancylostoma ceylanicum]
MKFVVAAFLLSCYGFNAEPIRGPHRDKEPATPGITAVALTVKPKASELVRDARTRKKVVRSTLRENSADLDALAYSLDGDEDKREEFQHSIQSPMKNNYGAPKRRPPLINDGDEYDDGDKDVYEDDQGDYENEPKGKKWPDDKEYYDENEPGENKKWPDNYEYDEYDDQSEPKREKWPDEYDNGGYEEKENESSGSGIKLKETLQNLHDIVHGRRHNLHEKEVNYNLIVAMRQQLMEV